MFEETINSLYISEIPPNISYVECKTKRRICKVHILYLQTCYAIIHILYIQYIPHDGEMIDWQIINKSNSIVVTIV